MMQQPFSDNRERQRFELLEDGQTVFADYRRQPGRLVITHVEAPIALRGSGAAGRLMQAVAEEAKAEGVKVLPICGYARAWLQRRKEYADLVV
jgi:predicted GNAT family acetyltransferase